mgnify:CR=1 FL=1
MTNTTIAVSENTKRLLDVIKKGLGLKTYDETVETLAKEKKKLLLEKYFGIGKGIKTKFVREKNDRNIT